VCRPEDRLLDNNAYEPWGYANDAWGWGNPPTPVLAGKFGELCLRKVENKWVLSWFNADDYDITIKVLIDRAVVTERPMSTTCWSRAARARCS